MSRILEPWIETYTGKSFYFLDPKEDQIDIRDIAHSLAYTCRYTGHSRRFYSVAEHSILVSYLAADALSGLLHDSSEAYITDIASPIKPHLSNYKELEDMIMGRIAAKFGFTYPLDPDIKDCDATQLKTEAKHLLHSGGRPWAYLYPTRRAHGITPNCWGPEEAEQKFLERFEEVRNDYVPTTICSPGSWIEYKTDVGGGSPPSIEYLCRQQSLPLSGGQVRSEDCSGESNHCGQDAAGSRLRYQDVDRSFVSPKKAI